MFSAHEGRGRRRRRRLTIPVAVAATGAGVAGAVLLMSPAHAGNAPLPPALHTAARPSAPSAAQLTSRVAGALAADSSPSRTTLSASPQGTAHTVDPKIIGGTTTTISTAPWMAQLWYFDDRGTATTTDDIGFFCGGTVVSPTKILTASHCVKGYDWFTHGTVITGTDQLPTSTSADNSTPPDLHGGTALAVARQWNHPSYNADTIDNDVAVLTLDTPVSAKPLPITSATDSASYVAGTTATVYGWGRTTSTTDDISQTLKKASLPINSNATCTSEFGAGFVAGHMVCAGTPATGSDAGTTTACNGDSGGPLVAGGKIIGVVSWGVEDCVEKGAYSVFSRTSTYAGAIDPRLDDANFTGDDKADLFARTPAGTAYIYRSTGTALAARESLGDFSGLNLVRQNDLNRDGLDDLIVRTTDGHLYWLSGDGSEPTLIGGGWNVMRSLVIPGDITGDGLPDLVGTDTSGTSWTYPGNGKGTFGTRIEIGTGWNTYSGQIYGKGDLSGDGRPDMVARDSSGSLWLYKGTGSASAPWAPRVRIGGGWSYNAYAAVGDMTGDGHADLLARDSAGTLWLYKGTGSASAPYAARVRIGGGWQIYNILG